MTAPFFVDLTVWHVHIHPTAASCRPHLSHLNGLFARLTNFISFSSNRFSFFGKREIIAQDAPAF
jgi:hypothetical protein